ncbi:hypothetical protein RF11_15318 [Thelohanellus kitauei]|uniref:Tc1-like transposase DDE domain-containing protein n=1 Tax=Thelohanellus kitauei TaxID=669202 RepID=A0A0C2IAH0_THEKT|nr:hypothetical protein RF11_15318 [Thelohanellus kitauei]
MNRIRNYFDHSFLRLEENYPDEQIYFVDEFEFNVSMRKMGRSPIGTTGILSVLNIRSKNLSVCRAMNRYGVVYKEINSRPYNTESFLRYMQNFFQYIQSSIPKNKSCVDIKENARFHKLSTPGNCGVKLMNFKTFQNMAANIDLSIAFLRNVGIIPGSLECEACCLQMAQHKRADISDQICSWKISTLDLKLGGPGRIVQIDESVISRAMRNRGVINIILGHDLLRRPRWVLGMYDATSKIGIVISIPNRKAQTITDLIMRYCV